jgi:hypothetical protein
MFMGEGNINLDSLDENRAPTKPVATKPKNDSKISTEYVELNWVCQDPDEDEVTYNVYFDKTSVGQKLLINNLKTPKYLVSDLEKLTTYYWKVEAIDEYGNKTMSNVFSFYVDTVAVDPVDDPILSESILAYISFDGSIIDNNNKQNVNSSGVSLTTDRNGEQNKAGNFMNNNHNSVSITSLPYTINNYTIAFWIKPTANYGIPYDNQIHIAGRYGTSNESSMKISLINENINISHENNGHHTINSNLKLSTNVWTHFSVTFNGNNLKVYLNGVLQFNGYLDKLPNPSIKVFSIGMDMSNNNRIFNGSIDEFYLFNKYLNEDEVFSIYKKY